MWFFSLSMALSSPNTILFMTENSVTDISVQALNELIDSGRSILHSINVWFTFFCYLIDISFLNENEEWEHKHTGSLFLHVKSSGNNHFGFGPIFSLLACEDWIDDTVSVTIFVLPQALQSSGKIRYVSYNFNDDLNSK